MEDEKREIKELKDKHKGTEDQIKNNNKNIASIGSGSYDRNQGIWQFITLENILVCLVIYAVWQIARDDKR